MRLLGLLFSIAAVIALSSCGTANAPSGTGTPQSSGGKTGDTQFKAALVTPGAINDGGWSENAYKGLKKIESELGAKVSNAVAGSPTDAINAFREFAKQDTNLIIGHASEWFDPQTLEIAKARPKSTFLISGSENAQDNVAGVRFLLEDGCYVLGQIAGAISKSGKLGCVGPKELPVIASTFHAFEQGAKSVRPDIKVEIVWTNDWADVARAKERTLILIENGADVIFHNANDGAPGVFQAVQSKKDKGVLCFGSNADQNAMADDVILASAVLDIPSVFVSLAKKVKDGTFDRKVQFVGMPDGFVWVSYNKKLEDRIPADVKKRADETAEKIKKREFEVPRLKLK
ncbi:MAG TPA: BMP family protein [Planctomycetota bacterium]|nr:BMP family protein [Planctomycetota bacterium]